jgi:hypothetical protein
MILFRRHRKSFSQFVCFVLVFCLCGGALCAQQQTPPPVVQQQAPPADIAFDTLLSTDSYKLYLEVRNVGQLLTTGGAGEIVEPIIKLADPGPQLKSLVAFLKEHAEELATSRLFFVTWPARTGIPTALAAIEFANPEEAKKFIPRLEKFLPEVLPPVPVAEPTSEDPSPPAKPSANASGTNTEARTQKTTEPATSRSAKPAATPEMRLPFVLTQSGSLVFISDTPFQAAKLHPRGRPLLAEDNNFRLARDRFASEPLFFFCNVKLEDKTQPKPSPTPVISEEERVRLQKEEEARIQKEFEEDQAAASTASGVNVDVTPEGPKLTAVVVTPSPTPTPTKEEQAQRIASNQIGSMLSVLGQGEPQWPDAIGLVVALDNDEYVLRAILIESDTAKRVTLPFVPQLISGPPHAPDAPSILPDDTELLVSTSIDFTQTYQEMKKLAESEAKAQIGRPKSERWENGVLVEQGPIRQTAEDGFVQFEKKARFKIADDLLPILGNELAIGMSLKQANMVNMIGIPTPPAPKSLTEKQKGPEALPIFMIAIRDLDAGRRLMPRVLDGLGIGEAKLIAQNEHVGDSEIVNFAGVFSYAFIGNFLVVSDSASVRRVAEAGMNGGTLGSNNAFRASRHWQPRQTLGEIYVSPVLMEGYQEQISKQAGTMDQSMRDFLMKLSPRSSAITYSLSRDGLGTLHELHLPKNLILAIVASTSATMNAMKQGSPEMNEMIAMSGLRMIASAEATFKSTAGNGSYGSIDQLAEQKLLSKEVFEKYGYQFDVSTSAQGFEAVAMPSEYGKSGRRSFFIDQSNILRAGDHGGGAATIADQPIRQ